MYMLERNSTSLIMYTMYANASIRPQGVHSLLYFAYTCVRDLFIWGGIYLA